MKRFTCVLAALVSLPGHALAEPTVASTTVIGPFTGAGAPLHPDNVKPHPIAYYGTDLGFSYVHDGKIHFLFGDTWATEEYAPIEESTGSRHDDGFGTIDLAAWPDPSSIAPGNVPLIRLAQHPDSDEMSAIDPGHAMDLGKTPMAGFGNGEREFAIFNITKPEGCAADSDCGNGLTCDNGLGYLGVRYDQEEGLTLPCIDESSPFCVADSMIDDAGTPIPGSGFCSDQTSTIWADTPAGRVTGIAYRVRIGLRSLSDARRYTDNREWLTGKFANVTARTVNDFVPSRGTDQDYARASGAGENQRVLLWGRPGFVGVNANGRTMGLYFAYVDMPAGPGFTWQVNYYTGTDEAGVPRFSTDQRDARPLDLDSTTPGVQPRETHDVVHQMSVVWVDHLGKWVMFYGGGISRIPTAPLPECGVLQLLTRADCQDVVVGNGAIRMRTADNPWGPWSPPQDVIAGGRPEADPPGGQYGPGGVLRHPDCTAPHCAPHTRTPVYHDDEHGFFYGVNIIEPWIHPAGAGVDVIWNVSTWDPYRVVLMETRINP